MKYILSQKKYIGYALSIGGIFIGTLYASTILVFPSISMGIPKFETRINTIKSTGACPAKSFIKGFNGANHVGVCVSYKAPATSLITYMANTIIGAPVSTPGNQVPKGKFGMYLENISGGCAGNGILQGFTVHGKKICVNARNRSSITESPAITPYGDPTGPTSPTGILGGNYAAFFTGLFSACPANMGVSGINSNGTIKCSAIPVDGICGASNGTSLYATPTANLCNSGTASVVYGSGPWTWTCNGIDNGDTVSCSAVKKVDGAWSAWSSFTICPVLECGGGIQTRTRTCTNPAPANGGLFCAGADADNQPCNTNGASGAGPFLVTVVPDGCLDDGGPSVGGDDLRVYCSYNRYRYCLSGEYCPNSWDPEGANRFGSYADTASTWCDFPGRGVFGAFAGHY